MPIQDSDDDHGSAGYRGYTDEEAVELWWQRELMSAAIALAAGHPENLANEHGWDLGAVLADPATGDLPLLEVGSRARFRASGHPTARPPRTP
jgi:hypothetical protein